LPGGPKSVCKPLARAWAGTVLRARLPSGRIGRVEDIADAIVFLMKSEFSTGTVLDVDGGHRLA
jgi:NAD(P)-dependent dehydrogenase (short-subunit alcohol dehydrogenase family)